jgi:hypothetical protein
MISTFHFLRELDNPKNKLNGKQRSVLVEIYDHVCRLHSRYREVATNCEELVTDINIGSTRIYSLLSLPSCSTATLRGNLKEAATISRLLALKTEKLPPMYTELTNAVQTFQLLINEKKREVEQMKASSRWVDKFLGCIKLALNVLAALATVTRVVTRGMPMSTGVRTGTTEELWDKIESFVNRGMYLYLTGMQYSNVSKCTDGTVQEGYDLLIGLINCMLEDVPTIQEDLSRARKAFMDRAYELKVEAMKINDSLDGTFNAPSTCRKKSFWLISAKET